MIRAGFELHTPALDLRPNSGELALVALHLLVKAGQLLIDTIDAIESALPVLLEQSELPGVLLSCRGEFLLELGHAGLRGFLPGLDAADPGLQYLKALLQCHFDPPLYLVDQGPCLFSRRLQV